MNVKMIFLFLSLSRMYNLRSKSFYILGVKFDLSSKIEKQEQKKKKKKKKKEKQNSIWHCFSCIRKYQFDIQILDIRIQLGR